MTPSYRQPRSFLCSNYWRACAFGLLALASALALPLTPAWADRQNLIIGYGEDSFPAYFQDENGWRGMDVDIVNSLTERAGLHSSVVTMKFPRIYQAIASGRVHIAVNLTKNDERSTFLDWLGPVRTSAIALITKPQFLETKITNYDDLTRLLATSKMKIAYVTGTSFSPSLDAKLRDQAFSSHLFFVSENAAARRMVLADRILGFFYDDLEAQAIIAAPDVAKATGFEGLVIHDFRVPGSKAGVYMGMSKRIPAEIRQRLQAAFHQMQQEGVLLAIQCKWVPQSSGACN